MNEDLEARLEKARRSLQRAHRDFAEGDHDFTVSGAYYAMFYAAEALLQFRGLTFSRHSAVIAAINREFVRRGELAHEYFDNFRTAFEERNIADYSFEQIVSEETARTLLSAAEAFVRTVEVKLGR